MPSGHQRAAPRAIVYARYSSDHQRDASIEDQIRECRAFIERQGWDYQHAYVDRALSGALTVRPGYQLMLEGARERQFDIAVAEALDRFSRDQEDIAALYKRFRFAGIALVTLAEGQITDLHVGLKGTMNALYLKDLADKTRRGLRGRVEAALRVAASRMATTSSARSARTACRYEACGGSTRSRPRGCAGSSRLTPPDARRAGSHTT